RIHHPDGAAGDRLSRLQKHVQHGGHERTRSAPGKTAPPGAERCAYCAEPEHGVLELLVRGMKVDLVDALTAAVVLTQHGRITVRESRQRLNPLRHQS